MRHRVSKIALLALLMSGSPAYARQKIAYVPALEVADAPAGFVEMCRRAPSECGLTEPAPAAQFSGAALTPRSEDAPMTTGALVETARVLARSDAVARHHTFTELASLRKVNRDVNGGYLQQDDLTTNGTAEFWQRPGLVPGSVATVAQAAAGAGDCEDFALEKRARLLAQGWSSARLRLAVVFHLDYGLHTVLVARLDDGDYVLDSRVAKVMRWQKARYRWLRIQSAEDQMIWRRVAQG